MQWRRSYNFTVSIRIISLTWRNGNARSAAADPTLLVIASLLALIYGILTRWEAREIQAEQQKQERIQRDQDFSRQMEKEKQKPYQLGGMADDLKKHKLF